MKLELIRTYCRGCNKTLYTKDGKPALCLKDARHERALKVVADINSMLDETLQTLIDYCYEKLNDTNYIVQLSNDFKTVAVERGKMEAYKDIFDILVKIKLGAK